MGQFTFGLSIIYPIFLVIGLGFYLGKKQILNEELQSSLSHLVFYYAMPLKLFTEITGKGTSLSFDWIYLFYMVLGLLAIYFLSWLLAKGLGLSGPETASFVQTAYRSNFIFIGFPILDMVLGTVNVPAVILVSLFLIPLNNILAIFVLASNMPGSDHLSFKDKCLQALKNPVIIATLFSVACLLIKIPLPKGLLQATKIIGQMSSPLGLLLIGSNLAQIQLLSFNKLAFFAALIRTFLSPLPLLILGRFLHFPQESMLVAFVFFASPCAANNFIFTKAMGGDTTLVSQGIFYSCLLAIFFLPLLYTLVTF